MTKQRENSSGSNHQDEIKKIEKKTFKIDTIQLTRRLNSYNQNNPMMAELVRSGVAVFLGIEGDITRMSPNMMEFLVDLGIITKVDGDGSAMNMLNS